MDHTHERLGTHHPTTISIQGTYARSLCDTNNFDGAEELAFNLLPKLETIDPEMIQQQSRVILSILAGSHVKKGQFDESLRYAERALLLAQTVLLAGDIRIAEFLKLRAGVLMDLGQYHSAETDLLKAWSFVDLETTITDQYEPIIRVLIELYQAWHEADPDAGYDEQSRHWESKLNDDAER